MSLTKLNFLLITLVLFSSPLWALSSDKKKPVEVEADSVHVDHAKKVTVYSGNVIIIQGSMNILADEITVYGSRGTTNKVVAVGRPVKFKQQPDGQQGLIRGEANHFEYLVNEDTLVLTDNATLWQSGHTFSSDKIVYDSKRSVVKAGDKKSSSKRVKITLKPAQ